MNINKLRKETEKIKNQTQKKSAIVSKFAPELGIDAFDDFYNKLINYPEKLSKEVLEKAFDVAELDKSLLKDIVEEVKPKKNKEEIKFKIDSIIFELIEIKKEL